MSKKTAGPEQTDIISALAELDRGRFVITCGREMHALTEAIRNTNRKGSLVIRLEVSPNGLRDGRVSQVEIKPSVTAALPKPDVRSSIFFVTDAAQLVRDDPEQMSMFDGPEPSVVA